MFPQLLARRPLLHCSTRSSYVTRLLFQYPAPRPQQQSTTGALLFDVFFLSVPTVILPKYTFLPSVQMYIKQLKIARVIPIKNTNFSRLKTHLKTMHSGSTPCKRKSKRYKYFFLIIINLRQNIFPSYSLTQFSNFFKLRASWGRRWS